MTRSHLRASACAAALAAACVSALAQSPEQAALLSSVSRLLADLRADPAKAAGAKCPAKLATLAGIPVGTVLIEMGQPEGTQARDSLAYAPRSGGTPQVTFRFNAQGVVTSVECRQGK